MENLRYHAVNVRNDLFPFAESSMWDCPTFAHLYRVILCSLRTDTQDTVKPGVIRWNLHRPDGSLVCSISAYALTGLIRVRRFSPDTAGLAVCCRVREGFV